MGLSETEFWKLIDTALWAYSDVDALYEVLADEVWHLEPEELKDFQRILEEQLALANTKDLWHAAKICLGDVDENAFLGFRCWLISRGKNPLVAAVVNPDFIAEIPYEGKPRWGKGESLIDLAGKAWLQWSETDESLPEELPETGIDFRTIPSGLDWDDRELGIAYPKLVKKFRG